MKIGLIMLIFLLILIITYTLIHPKIKKFMATNKYWIISSIIFFTYNFSLYIYRITNLFEKDFNIYSDPTIYSDIFLFNFCSFMTFFLPIYSFFNPTKQIAMFMYPLGFVASLFVCVNYGLNSQSLCNSDPKLFFYEQYGSGLRHFLLCIYCWIGLLNISKISWRKGLNVLIFWVIFMIYIYIFSQIIYATSLIPISCQHISCSGLYEQDFMSPQGNFYFMHSIKFPWCQFLFFTIGIVLITLVCFITNKMKNTIKYCYVPPLSIYYKNNKIYYKKWLKL